MIRELVAFVLSSVFYITFKLCLPIDAQLALTIPLWELEQRWPLSNPLGVWTSHSPLQDPGGGASPSTFSFPLLKMSLFCVFFFLGLHFTQWPNNTLSNKHQIKMFSSVIPNTLLYCQCYFHSRILFTLHLIKIPFILQILTLIPILQKKNFLTLLTELQ